jgi:hypothetical protein
MMELSKHLQRKQGATCHMRNKAYFALPVGERLATSISILAVFEKGLPLQKRGGAAAIDAKLLQFCDGVGDGGRTGIDGSGGFPRCSFADPVSARSRDRDEGDCRSPCI